MGLIRYIFALVTVTLVFKDNHVEGAVTFTTPANGDAAATNALPENVAVATTAETVVATGGGTSVTYSIVSVDGDTSSTLFAIGNDDEVQCKATPGFDYETKKSYKVLVKGLDNATPTAASATATLTIKISDIDDHESTLQQTCGSATSDALSGDVVANVAVCDADVQSAITYEKVASGSTDNDAFDIDSNTGVVTKSSTAFADSTKTSYLQVFKAKGVVNTATGTLTITIGGSCACLSTSNSGSSGLSFGLFTMLAALVLLKI